MAYIPYAYDYPQSQPRQPWYSLAFVNDEQEARNSMVLPGNSVILMSRNDSVFWIKSTSQDGITSQLRAFDYTERQNGQITPVQPTQAPGIEYVPRSEYDALAARVEALEGKKCACRDKTDAKEDLNGKLSI